MKLIPNVHTGYKMLENTDLKLSVFQHFLYLFHIKSGGIYMRQDIQIGRAHV